MFNPHLNKTADGVVITPGLKVFTNELTIGTVVSDDNDAPFRCCQPTSVVGSHYDPIPKEDYLDRAQLEHLIESGQMTVNNAIFTNHNYVCELSASYDPCGHDHWFTVQTKNGTKSFNGERLATVFEGKKAE